MTARRFLTQLSERQIGDETRLRRVVALFQRDLGRIFGNANVRRRNRRYEIDVAVYEQPLPGGRSFKMPERQIAEWVRQAAQKAHPRLYKRINMQVDPWRMGHASRKLFAPLRIFVDARQA